MHFRLAPAGHFPRRIFALRRDLILRRIFALCFSFVRPLRQSLTFNNISRFTGGRRRTGGETEIIPMVYLFLADGFEEIEALTPVDILRRAGSDVKTVAVGTEGKTVTGSHKIRVEADMTEAQALDSLSRGDLEMIILPGGMPGAGNLNASGTVDAFIKEAVSAKAYIGAICAAPYLLGVRGLLKGRMATCFPGFEDRLEGAQYYDCDVIRDGEFILGRAMGAATEFALELAAALFGDSAAEEMRGKILA